MHALSRGLAAILLAFTLGHPLDAQPQTIVSPNGATSVEGSGANVFPWSDTRQRRYMQIHSDIGGVPKFITKLAWRKDGSGAASGSGTFDMELYLGDSVDWNQAKFVTKSNYLRPPTLAVARKIVTLGPLTGTGSPSPFDLAITLDQPYLYIGNTSLAWEAVLYSSSPVAQSLDADLGSYVTASPSYAGSGCVATGQTAPMAITISASDVSGCFGFGGYLVNGPANAASVLFLGTTNPSTSTPVLCGALHTDLVVGMPIGTTDATGYIGATSGLTTKYPGGAFAFMFPNTFAGAPFTMQAHSLDAGSSYAVKVANSNGAALTVPAAQTAKINKTARIFNNDNGPTEQNAIFFSTSTIGFAIVTQFTY